MPRLDHPTGGYRTLPGIAPYSCGVVSQPGFEIVRVILQSPVPYRTGFDRVDAHLASQGRPRAALCAMGLRCPKPYTFQGFADFNAEYAGILRSWGVMIDGVNPVARTNVAPVLFPPTEPLLYEFCYTRPCHEGTPPSFVVAGAGELPEGVLARDQIVALGDRSPSGLVTKASYVMDLMESRLTGLGVCWAEVTTVNIYTAHSITPLLPEVVLGRIGAASIHGAVWHYSNPPIEEIEYEMDVRGTRIEFRL